MDLPSKDMYDTFKDEIWKELGPLDPDWFTALTAQATANEGNVSDQDDLCSNQEGNFKTPFDKTAVDSQLFSTPKVFRHCRVLSPETEDEKSFAAEQGKETLPWSATQSPHLFQMSNEGVQGVKYGGIQHQSQDLIHTPQKSPVSYAKHVSESLGADIHPDISWTSSLNTPPPLASTLILTKAHESPCPASVPAVKNVVFVRKLFPSLSNASRVGVVSPKNNDMTTIHQGTFSHGAGQNPESFNSPLSPLNRSDCVWRQKLPDAIEDGEIRSTVTSVLDGADDVLSILFNNSSSTLRKVKTDKIKRKQILSKRERGCSSTDIPTSTAAPSEQQMADKKTDGPPSHTPLKAGDIGITQWSPLSLSEIPLCTVDTSGCNSSAQEENNSRTQEHLRRDFDCGQLGRPHVKVTSSGLSKKKRKFVYTVETTKLQVQGEDEFQKTESLPGIPDSGQDVNLTQLMRAPEEVHCCNIRKIHMKKQDYLAEENLHPSEQSKVQDLDISQLSRDFAQDFSQMPDPGQVSNMEKDTPQNDFSPSACLSAMKQANQKARQGNLHHDYVSNTSLINEGTVNDSGFQSAVAGVTNVTASSFVLPSSENNGQSQQWLDFISDIHMTTSFSCINNGKGKAHWDGNLHEAESHAVPPSAIKENQTLSPAKETTILLNSAKATVDNINYIPPDGRVHRSVQEKTVFLPSVLPSGFQTASHKSIQISSHNLEKAKHLFEGEISLSNQLEQCTSSTEDKLGLGHGSVTNNNNNNFHLTASEKADVTELCTLLEEADSQFEFTQFKTAELKRNCEDDATLPQKVDKEVDADFLTGIDFDDSFNSDAEKHLAQVVTHDQVAVVSAETSNTISKSTSLSLLNAVKKEKSSTEDVPKHILESKSSIVSAETQNFDRDDHTETSKLENENSLMLGVGFKTAGGNVLRVSKKCLSKARALFADLEENLVKTEKSPTKQSREPDPKMQQKCSVDSHTGDCLHFKEHRRKLISLDRQQSDNEDGTESLKNIKMNTSKCQSGFQMASGKEISISAKAMQEAGVFFKDCDTIDAKASTSVTHKGSIETLSGSVSPKVNLQKCKITRGMRVQFSEDPITEFENKTRPAVHSTEAAKESHSFAFKNTVALRNTSFSGNSSKHIGSSGIGLSNGGEICPANGAKELVMADPQKNAGMHTFEDANKHLSNQILVSPSVNGGFQTASGKGVTISSAALRKARSLLIDYNEVEDKVCVKQKHSEMPVHGPSHRNLGFLAASGKKVAFSSEALQKAKALFSDISFSAEIPAVSHMHDDKKQDDVENMEKTHCGFSTAGGAKATVKQNNMLKAKTLSKEFEYGSFSAKEIQEVDSCFKDCDFMDGEDGKSAKQRKCITPVLGCDREKTHATKCKDQRVNSTNAAPVNGTLNGSLTEKPSLSCTSKNIDCASINELSNDAGCHTASRKKVSMWSDAMTSAKSLLREHSVFKASNKQLEQKCDTLSPQNSGFHTASGKGVAISSAALKKAKKLLSECEGVEDKISVQATLTKTPVPGPVHRNPGFLAASGKTVAFSSEALQKAKALFSDIGFNAEIPAVSDTRNSKHDIALCDSKKSHCGFTTAGGAKVHVSQKDLLKAKNLFRDFTDGEWYNSSSNSATSHDSHERCKENDAEITCISNLITASDKDVPSKGNAPQVVKSLPSLYVTVHENENSSECALKKKMFKAGKNALPGVSHLHDNPREEMSSVLEYEISQTSSSEVSKVKKTEESSVVCLQSLNLSGCTETQQKFLAQEALDCTKALLEDENLAGHSISMTSENMLLHDNPKSNDGSAEDQKGKGKRLIEDTRLTSQPPPKKRLLEDFERTVDGLRGSTLHPEKSSPNGSMKDRRVFKYSSSLHPNITGPQNHSYLNGKNYVEARIQKATQMKPLTPENNKPANSKMACFIPPFFKNTDMEGGKSTVLEDNIRTPSTFVPPFKKQRFFQENFSKPHEDKLHHLFVMPCNSNTVPPTEKTQSTTAVNGSKNKENVQTLALTDTTVHKLMNNSDNNEKLPVGCGSEDSTSDAPFMVSRSQDKFLNVHNVELARDIQDMRIRKKKRQTIRPLPGSLFLTKTSGISRIPLKAAVNGKPPTKYTQKQLYSHGVHQHVCDITSETAESFRFNLQQFISQEAFIDGGGVQLADGGWLIPSSDGMAGKEEFYRSLCDTPGVDSKLITEEWVYNHYRWIVWKQASMERSFPEMMGGLSLTPEQVLLQLKYRYDVEVDNSRRPALRKIMEKDDTAAKTLILCVCGIISWGHSPKRHSLSDIKTPGVDAKFENPSAVVWLTDGWYAIKAQLDEPLTAMLHKGRLVVGGKLVIHGAQLVGSQDACSPLEAPESLMLKICANSSRPARWDAKLGFHRDPRPFLLPVSSLYSNGGPVGCVDVIILRSYPIQWMERKPEGGTVFRSVRAEEKEARRYDIHKQKAMEIVYAKIQAEFEKEESGNTPQRRRRTISRQEIASLLDGEELYEAVGDDPTYLEAQLSEQQMEALHNHRRSLMEKKQADLQDRYRRALENAEDGEGSCPKRDVTPVWRLCVADSMDNSGSVYQMNLWRPPSDLQSLLKEGCRYKVYNLTTSDAKKHGGSTTVQLTGTKKTQFEEIQASQEWLSTRFQQRVSTHFVDLQNREFQPLCGEVDLTGYIVSIIDGQGFSPAFYLADGQLNFIKVRCFSSLAQSGLEDVVKPRILVALSNLQLRGQSTSPTPVVYAGDITVFSTNPKEVHLQESLSQLRNLVQVQENLFLNAEEKLSHLLKSDCLSSISSPALQTRTPASTMDRTPKNVKSQQSVRSLGSFTPVSRNPTNCPTEKDLSSLKRKRALDYLSRIPSPPPLSLLNSVASPCVKKTFVPPRRSVTPKTLRTVQTPTPKLVHSPVEDEWVNDEELAMINTQTLLSGDSVVVHDTV